MQQYTLGDEQLWQHLSWPSFQGSSYILVEKKSISMNRIGMLLLHYCLIDPSQREMLFLCIQLFSFLGHFYSRGMLLLQQNKHIMPKKQSYPEYRYMVKKCSVLAKLHRPPQSSQILQDLQVQMFIYFLVKTRKANKKIPPPSPPYRLSLIKRTFWFSPMWLLAPGIQMSRYVLSYITKSD